MKKLYISLIFMLASLSLLATINVIASDAMNIQVEFILDDYSLEELDSFIRLNAPKMMYPHSWGAPELPFDELKIALPPSGNIGWKLTILGEEQLTLSKRVAPVPHIFEQETKVSQYHYLIDESLYEKTLDSYVQELPSDVFRGYSYGSLRVNPFRYDGQKSLSILKHAIINIQIDGDVSQKNINPPDDLAELFLDAVINPSQAQYWQQHSRSNFNFAPFSKADYWLKIEVDKNGMHQLTKQNLSSLPVDDIDPRSIRIFTTGGAVNPNTVNFEGPAFKEIPIKVLGEEDGHFDAADRIIFYAENRDGLDKTKDLSAAPTIYNPYSQNGIYWLCFGGSFPTPALRMQALPPQHTYDLSKNSHKTHSRLETESLRNDNFSFDWYSSKMAGSQTADYQYTLNVSNLSVGGENSITIQLCPEENKNFLTHKIKVWVNDTELPPPYLGYFSWSGNSKFSIKQNKVDLHEGENQVRIQVLRNGTDNILLDFIHIEYEQQLIKPAGQYIINAPIIAEHPNIAYQMQTNRTDVEIYRIDSLSDVKQLSWQSDANTFISPNGFTTKFVLSKMSEYHSPASISLREPIDLTMDTTQLDHIIISPLEFLSQAQSLAAMYQEFYGLSVKVTDQEDIFNQFNGGHPDPIAIRQYLRYVYKTFDAPKLQGVTLLGIGTIDWRNKSRMSTPKNKIMVYLQGETSSDDFFAMMDSSSYPELIIGRYPVRTTAELNTMLSNYRAYVHNPTPGWWRNTMVFLADDLYNGSQSGAETSHTRQMESAAASLHKSIQVDKIFAWEYDYDEYQNKPAARDDMIASVNEGVLVWYYIGHGSYDSLGSEDYFNGATDLMRLNNSGRQPFFIAASCKVSEYDHWGFESLGQKLVMMDKVGAIASFSATRMSGGVANTVMVEHLLDELSRKRHPLGKSIMAAKFRSPYDGNDLFYVLLGDPTLRVNPPVRDSLMSVNGTDHAVLLRSRQQAHIEGSLAPFSGDGTANMRFMDSGRRYILGSSTEVSQQGKPLFKGDVSVTSGSYQGGFIVPDDVTNGNTGSILSYLWDEASKQDYLNYFYPVNTRDNAVEVENDGPPKIELFLGTLDFRAGDIVSTSTTLIAKISDGNGINITDSAGHHIFLVIDDAIQPIPVTQYFSYNKDSFTEGILRYPLPKLSEGLHTVQLIVFDNLNLPSVASTQFIAKHSSELSIQRLLPYPNPMQDEGYITFILSEDAQLDIGIYSISGKRIKRIQSLGREGFNQIPIDAKDSGGNRLANNTYFIKVKAKAAFKSTEAIERLVIYK